MFEILVTLAVILIEIAIGEEIGGGKGILIMADELKRSDEG